MFYTKQDIQKKLEEIPEVSRQAMRLIDLPKVFQELGEKHALLIDEVDTLGDIVMATMTGILQPELLQSSLHDELSLTPDTAKMLVYELNEQVFQPVHDKIIELSQAGEVERETTEDLGQAGVEVEPLEPTMSSTQDEPTPNRGEVLSDIENPKPTRTIVHDKLENLFTLPQTTSDHSVVERKLPTSAPSPKQPGQDPYLEPLE